ncbi:MAG TPA: precorrin-4 C(11)-methyltransferase [Isosphaeraceae bacterium]|jgi:precorrin-4/cobalt-precorrin-4 C11-methyltransferase
MTIDSRENSQEPRNPTGTVYFIGAGPGDPDLITVRGRTLIERCPVCLFAGSLVPRAVVAHAPPGAIVRNTASLHLDQIVGLMVDAAARGQDVARVHSGDPGLYGAIAEQMRRLEERGVPCEVVPGVSSFQAAAAALKIELTPAGKNQTVILTRAPGQTGRPGHEDLADLARHRTGMCLFLSAAQMPAVVAALLPHYGPDAPVVVAERVGWPDQRFLHAPLAEVARRMAEADITRTALVLIGPMLDDAPPAASRLYDKSYGHVFRKARPEEEDLTAEDAEDAEKKTERKTGERKTEERKTE